jgi:hypothetical protein
MFTEFNTRVLDELTALTAIGVTVPNSAFWAAQDESLQDEYGNMKSSDCADLLIAQGTAS